MDDFLAMRENKEVMGYFCDNFLSQVVGRVQWRDGVTSVPVNKLATVMDEAFALLVLENIWEVWMTTPLEELKKAAVDANGKRVVWPSKYMSNWQSAKRLEGWSTMGHKRMNELMVLVKQDQAKNGDWDRAYLEEKKSKAEGGRRKRKASAMETEQNEKVKVNDDFGDVLSVTEINAGQVCGI